MAILGSDPYPGPDPYQKMIQETDILDPLKRYHRLFEARIHSGLGLTEKKQVSLKTLPEAQKTQKLTPRLGLKIVAHCNNKSRGTTDPEIE